MDDFVRKKKTLVLKESTFNILTKYYDILHIHLFQNILNIFFNFVRKKNLHFLSYFFYLLPLEMHLIKTFNRQFIYNWRGGVRVEYPK